MPLYEYRCLTCSRVTEVMQRFVDPPPAACDVCGGPLEKLASAPAIQFKGEGWYVTDYGKMKGGETSAAATDPPKATPSKSPEPSAASKEPSSTAEAKPKAPLKGE